MYSSVSEAASDSSHFDNVSVASSKRRFGRKRINSELSEPLTSAGASIVDEELGSTGGDPYFVFRSDLQKKLELVDEALADFLRIVNETDTAVNTHEFKDAKKKLKRQLKNAESTLKDVHTTVQVVEKDRDKFSHIDDAQLYERQSLVNTSRERIQKAKDEINSEGVKLKLLEDERNKAVRRSGDGLLGARNDDQRRNTAFVLDNQAQTSLLMNQQDETLDELGEAVTRVGEMAGGISEEIGLQNKMLDELDEDLTNVEEELGMVMGKLAKFLKTKDKWQLRTICT
eukprot:CAMPEP_0176019434 /NCGR_PEP_ID=MMETSP0120_2-20121206/9388_1 /TAXON_ID=160619 /ORGANISM="Kryptoperidinium foliaceum, Strain CCMP 1326" /LENGTH=285 /DNA_ID=CAMNT_0017352509 /DNA_START=293 /DNA_END=1147 /DNA_ORIENTATION=+